MSSVRTQANGDSGESAVSLRKKLRVSTNENAAQQQAKVTVILGAQWGDEGKGKVVDMLATEADIVCRCQVIINVLSALFFHHHQFSQTAFEHMTIALFFSS